MPAATPTTSARRDELLELAYGYVLENGLAGMSLRPLATAIGSSPRVLLFLFGTKDGLLRALLARARRDELELLARVRATGAADLAQVASEVWGWLAADERRGLLVLWTESYARALTEPRGPWAGFAAATVQDWLDLLAQAQAPVRRATPDGEAERALVLAILRGALLDLLATGDVERTSAAVALGLAHLRDPG
jgi:AcrR family transcriptional regulator